MSQPARASGATKSKLTAFTASSRDSKSFQGLGICTSSPRTVEASEALPDWLALGLLLLPQAVMDRARAALMARAIHLFIIVVMLNFPFCICCISFPAWAFGFWLRSPGRSALYTAGRAEMLHRLWKIF